MVIRIAETDIDSTEATEQQPAEPLNGFHASHIRVLRALMDFYETGQVPDEETEVDLMVQLSGMVHGDWRIED